jgi:hypothetical protein
MPNPIPALVATMIALSALTGLPAPAAAAEETPTAKQCIGDDDTAYAEDGRTFTFTMNFHNACDRPIACEVDAYAVGARPGPGPHHSEIRPQGASAVDGELHHAGQGDRRLGAIFEGLQVLVGGVERLVTNRTGR